MASPSSFFYVIFFSTAMIFPSPLHSFIFFPNKLNSPLPPGLGLGSCLGSRRLCLPRSRGKIRNFMHPGPNVKRDDGWVTFHFTGLPQLRGDGRVGQAEAGQGRDVLQQPGRVILLHLHTGVYKVPYNLIFSPPTFFKS